MRTSHAIVVGLSLFALVGCNRIKEKLAEKAAEKVAEKVVGEATGTEVDIGSSSGTITIRDPKTGAIARGGTAATVPDGWPSSAPIYPGAKVVASLSTPDGKQVTFTTTDSVDKVHSFYKAKLPGKQEAAIDLGASKTLSTKDGTTTYLATIGKGESETSVHLVVTTK